GGILSHRGLEERRDGGGLGMELLRQSDRHSSNRRPLVCNRKSGHTGRPGVGRGGGDCGGRQWQTVALIDGLKLLPSLKARPNGNELLLSWPTNAPAFRLQSTLDLTG